MGDLMVFKWYVPGERFGDSLTSDLRRTTFFSDVRVAIRGIEKAV